jgi:hypothetical protein
MREVRYLRLHHLGYVRGLVVSGPTSPSSSSQTRLSFSSSHGLSLTLPDELRSQIGEFEDREPKSVQAADHRPEAALGKRELERLRTSPRAPSP